MSLAATLFTERRGDHAQRTRRRKSVARVNTGSRNAAYRCRPLEEMRKQTCKRPSQFVFQEKENRGSGRDRGRGATLKPLKVAR